MTTPTDCPGPLIWFEVEARREDEKPAAILECAACGFVIITGNFYDERHVDAPLMREGLA